MKKRSSTPQSATPIQIAITLAGGPTEAARLVGIERQNIYRWLSQGRIVSEKAYKQAELLSAATGGQVGVGEILSGLLERRRRDGCSGTE